MSKDRQRWKWAITGDGRDLILFEDGTSFDAKTGKPAIAFSEEGHEWRTWRSLPKRFSAVTEGRKWRTTRQIEA